MLCDSCKNKSICKYYDVFRDAPMVLEIRSCEKFSGQSVQTVTSVEKPRIRTPIDYKDFDIKEEIEDIEDEEKIYVDLTDNHESKVVSITDMLLGGIEDEKR